MRDCTFRAIGVFISNPTRFRTWLKELSRILDISTYALTTRRTSSMEVIPWAAFSTLSR